MAPPKSLSPPAIEQHLPGRDVTSGVARRCTCSPPNPKSGGRSHFGNERLDGASGSCRRAVISAKATCAGTPPRDGSLPPPQSKEDVEMNRARALASDMKTGSKPPCFETEIMSTSL